MIAEPRPCGYAPTIRPGIAIALFWLFIGVAALTFGLCHVLAGMTAADCRRGIQAACEAGK